MISVPKEKQLLTFERAFGGNHDAANLLSRLQDELEENPEVVPEYINLKPAPCRCPGTWNTPSRWCWS